MDSRSETEAIYLYGVVPQQEYASEPIDIFTGIDGIHPCEIFSFGQLIMIICRVDQEDYSRDQLEQSFRNHEWLCEKANHHHKVMEYLHGRYTFLPASLCTVFLNEQRLKNESDKHYDHFLELFELLRDKEEWNLKIYCDDKRFNSFVIDNNQTVIDRQNEFEKMTPGKRYLLKKSFDQVIEREAQKQKAFLLHELQGQLKNWCAEFKIKENWTRELTSRNDEMILNGVFLVSKPGVQCFLDRIEEFRTEYAEFGWSLEVSGPWPMYHFAGFRP